MRTTAPARRLPQPGRLRALALSTLARIGRGLRSASRHEAARALDDKLLADIGLTRAFLFANTLAPCLAAHID